MSKNFDRASELGRVTLPGWQHFPRLNYVLNLLAAALIAFAAASGFAAPFAQKIPYTQPDGTQIEIWGEGDEFYAVFESLDGYTVVFDPATKTYQYAQLSPDGSTLLPTGSLVGKDDPATLGLTKHLRITPDAAKKQAEQRFQQWDQETGASQQWANLKVARQKALAAARKGMVINAPPSYTTTGLKVGLTLLIDFSDDVATMPQSNIVAYCNGDGYTGYGNNGSVKEYYYDVSGGMLTYTNVVTCYIRAPHPKSYYNDTSGTPGLPGPSDLVRDCIGVMTNMSNYATEILPMLEALTVDDSNNILACNVFFAGANSGVWAKGLWPCSSGFGTPIPLPGTVKKVRKWQITNIGTALAIGTFCHENGHMLCGFPDIYDYGYDSRGGAGSFCIMDSGGPGTNPVQFCAYLKDAAGWATTTDIPPGSSQTISVSSSGTGFNHFYRYNKPGVSTEYFLVENRQKSGRDISLSAAGIAIWHIDELGNKDNQSMTNNFAHANYEVTLVQADNLWHFERNVNAGDANDLYYTGNTATGYSNEFTDNTTPNAHWWDGTVSGVRFRDFSVSGSTMTFAVVGYDAPVEGGTTNIVNGVTVNSRDYMVGSNGSFYALIITNAGRLTVTNDSFIGHSPYSSNNSARVTGAGSVWTSGTNLYVGAFGANNSLTISDGGSVSNAGGFIGLGASANNNSVLVTDAGSVWSNSGYALQVGVAGSFNQMTILNGGAVVGSNSSVGTALGANSNAVLVSGSDSTWTNGGSLFIGSVGSGNKLIITNGGGVFNNFAYIGVASGSVNNAVVVSGTGSFWRSASVLYVGSNGSGNRLSIASGGQVTDAGAYIGFINTSSNNAVFVSGAGSVWTNSASLFVGNSSFGNSLSISDGARVNNTYGYIGNNGSAGGNTVLVTGAGSVWTNSSYLYVGNSGSSNSLVIANGGQVFNGYGHIGSGSSASNNSALVTGAGSTWNNANNFFVGVNGSGSRLIITNGGQVNVIGGGNIASAANSTNNVVVVAGVGSVWSNGISTYVGVNGSLNSLTITDGGTVVDMIGQIGFSSTASNNTVLVTGSSSLWTNSRNLYVGNSIGNLLAISDGGQVVSVTGFVGFLNISTNNAVFVSDPGSLWNNLADLHVGSTGSFNQLTVINGGMVKAAADAYVGYSGGASNNWVFVTGAGSTWSNAGALTVGRGGLGNGVTLADGGQIYASVLSNLNGSVFGMSGGNAFFSRVYNNATITQTGGQFDPNFFDNAGLLQITGGTNIATVFLNEISGIVEQNNGEQNANSATNFGTWIYSGGVANLTNFENMTGAQLIGAGGAFNGSITSAGTLSFGDSPNTLPVSGNVTLLAGSLVTMNAGGTNLDLLDRLDIGGLLTAGGTLKVSLQGDYTPTNGDVFDLLDYSAVAGNFDHLKLPALRGYDWDTSHLLASAADPLSGSIIFSPLSGGSLTNIVDGVVTNAGAVYTLGDSSSMDDMVITNGGVLIDNSGILGNQAAARYNRAIVTGTGSIWNNSNDVYVGYAGFGNQLILTNGGTVLAGNAYVGRQTSASNNTVIVTGPGSVWSNAGVLTVGSGGTDNGVTLGDEGRIYATVLSNLSGSIVSVSGGSLLVSRTYNGATIVQGGGRLEQGVLDNAGLLQLTNGVNTVVALLNEASGVIEQDGGEQHASVATNFGVWTVSDGILYATNSSGNGSLENRGGKLTLNGGSVEADRFMVTNSAFNFNAGTLTTRGGQIYMSSASNFYVGTIPNQVGTWNVQGGTTLIRWSGSVGETILGGFAGAISSLNITGTGTLWSNWSSNLEVGMQSGGNLLTISDGARAFNLTGIVGNSTVATNNSAVVNGTGSMWSNTSNLIIGYDGRSNVLAVGSGATVICSIGYIGRNEGASNNSVQITGGGSLWRNSSTLYVGYGGQCNSLTISDGGRVFTTWGYIGNNSTAGSNIAVVAGLGSLWSNTSSLTIGSYGRVNSLFVTNGATVLNTIGVIGSGSTANSNVVLVSDASSVWSNSSFLQIGLSGYGNSLTIANGGRVFDTSGRVGLNSGANYNSVLVADSGSLWSHSGELLLGSNSYGNRLIITNGGQVFDASATIGFTNRYNSALVTGSGSLWSNAGSLFVGYWGTTNSLTIADGGTVTATNLIMGAITGYGGNAVTNAGGNLIVTNGTTNARIEILGGSLTFNGGSITTDTLVATNNTFSSTNSLFDFNAGTLTTRGNSQIISAGSNHFVIGGLADATAVWNVFGGTNLVQQLSGSTSNTVLGGLAGATGVVNVAGAGTVWSNANNLWIGGASAGNQLVVTNGARAINYHGYLGYSFVGGGNNVLVSDSGSLWSNTGNLYVGNSSSSNVLLISNGGAVVDVNGYVGNGSIANSNRVSVTGSGSLWRNNGALYVGNLGNANGLSIANGGQVVNTVGYVGNNSNANGNVVLVQDAGSLWSNSSTLYVGYSGLGNAMTVTNGGRVVSTSGYVGYAVTASNSVTVVTGTGSVWSTTTSLVVGNSGSANKLTIADGGQVVNGLRYIGYNAAATNNSVLVTGSGSVWSNIESLNGTLYIGYYGPSNSLTIASGGQVFSAGGSVGSQTGSINNIVQVAGTGSVWANTGTINLGSAAGLNRMIISDGGAVMTATSIVGNAPTSSSNTALVTDFGSLWSNLSLIIGGNGAGNSLAIVNSGVVTATSVSSLGAGTGASNNSVLVTGVGSTWNAGANVYVGNSGSGNNLTVTNGGQVLSGTSYIGCNLSANNNTAIVSGDSSIWTNSGSLYVGYAGRGNSLTIGNGGTVLNNFGHIGYAAESSNNSVWVTDPGSLWSNADGSVFYVGMYGSSNSLVIANSGRVDSYWGYIGCARSASNNAVLVTGAGSLWDNNTTSLRIGNLGSGNRLTIAGGGHVLNGDSTIGNYDVASNNAVLVTGTGSLLSNSSSLLVGASGSFNNLTIASGGQVLNANGVIGAAAGSRNNTVLVNGAGSLWSNSGSLYVGATGSYNQLTLTNGGSVRAANVMLGSDAASISNLITLSGGYLYVTNLAQTGTLDIRRGTLTLNSGTVVVNRLYLTNNASSIINFNAGLLRSGGCIVSNGVVFTVGDGIHSAVLDLMSGTHSFAGGLAISTNASLVGGSSLSVPVIVNDGQFAMTGGTLSVSGAFTNAADGTFNLSGGSVLVPLQMNNMGTFIQSGGFFDPEVFTNSGSFALSGGTNIAEVFLNLLSGTVTQSGGEQDVNYATNFGLWTISGGVANLTNFINDGNAALTVSGGALNGSVTVGGTGSFNQLTVSNGGMVIGSIGLVGNLATARSNSALVTGSGSVWSNSGNLYVGSAGSFNQLTITNAAVTINNNGYIGFNNNGQNNTVLVAGSGSVWKNNSYLYVGNSGSSNRLTIQSGGVVRNTYCYIGNNSSSSNNTVLVTGAGSVWSNSAILIVGENGPGNQLTIANSGKVFNTACFIGDLFGANSNTVLVTGLGSVWSNKGNLFVGNFSSGNQLTISNGGAVFDAYATVGNSNNNGVLVTGTGSVWNSSGSLVVGSSGSGNQLTITNGGTVFNTYAILGSSPGANSNVVLVTGGESVWSNSSGLTVGYDGVSNRLTIANGGAVFDTSGYIGYSSGGNSNAVLVTGANSVWLNSSNLWVGTFSSGGNQLTIADGGTVVSTNIVIGYLASTGNIIAVSGGNLFGTNAAANGTLNVRYGTLALNSGTVTVDRFLVINGASSVVNFNGGTLNSGGSTLNNGSIFQVGNGTSAANLHLLGGTHSFANSLFINTNGCLTGTGAITGVITNAGTIAPGNSPGILTVSGDLTLLTNSLLLMELAGTNDGLYDQINVSGAFAFDGTLTLSLLDGFTVSAGDRFDLFDFSSSSGAFSVTNLPGLAALMYWDTSGLYTSGEVEADWMTGSLQVTVAPVAAVSAGAQWQVDGGAWQNSGDTVANLVIGEHTLSFKTVAGWATPTNRVVQVNFGEITATNATYEELMPVLLAVVSRKTHSAAGTFNQTLNLNPAVNPTVEPRKSGPTQLLFTFNKEMMATDGTLDASEFTLTNATYVSASILSSNLTLNLTNAVDQSKVTVVLNGLSDLTGNPLMGTNAVKIRALYGDANQSGTVNIADMQTIKFKLGSALSATNFIYDLNLSGAINIADMQVAKSMLSHTVPANSVDTGANSLVTLLDTTLSATGDNSASTVTLGEALGAPELVWNTDGDAVWTTTTSLDGSYMAWSGSIGHLNVSWVETTVTGPGTLSFQWKVSSEADADYLTFSIDGEDQPGRISGEVDWQTMTLNIPSGTHRLTWTYAKNGSNAAGLDAGWLRRVSYQRAP